MPNFGVRTILVLLGKPLYLLFLFLLLAFYTLGINFIKLVRFIGWIILQVLILPYLIFQQRPKKLLVAARKLLAVLFFLLFLGAAFLWAFYLFSLPNPSRLTTSNVALSTKIYDRHGNLLYKIYRNQNRTWVPLDQIPVYVRQATIAIEDAEFYQHKGFSLRGIIRAAIQNLLNGQLSGGSTITQQLVKNVLLSPEKTLTRKIKEIILSIKVESTFSKDQILEMYLNQVSYGGSTYGIEEASQTYFGKSVQALTLAEAALLAGLPKAPTTYSPFGANPQLARARQLEVLSRMVQQGYITTKDAEEAAKQRLVFAPQKTDIKAPHFVMYVKQLLVDKYGEQMVSEGGLSVTTSLDLNIQEVVEKIVLEEVEKIHNLRVSNGAALVTSPSTGEILAMVGSKNYFDTTIDGNFNVTTASRQPGSAIKPVNYSYALESKKYTAASILSDTPITFWIPGSPPYTPRNYDNRFHGNVSLRTALGSSLNIPAVKVLASYGVSKMIEQGKKLGITTWNDPSRFGLSLTLGGGEVKMTDLATVYGTLANYGKRVDLKAILRVTDAKGKILEENNCAKETEKINNLNPIHKIYAAEVVLLSGCGSQVLDPRVAFILTDILSDNSARTPAFGPNSLLVIPGHPEVAVKTGTTQNLRDNWAIGYTKDYVVATWVGNNDNRPMAYVASGITGATPIWNKIMQFLLSNKESYKWEVPAGIVKTEICTIAGTLPCEGCSTQTEYFLEGTEPTSSCNLEEYFKNLEQEKRKRETTQIL
jgi:1A family penicillin-binding protein